MADDERNDPTQPLDPRDPRQGQDPGGPVPPSGPPPGTPPEPGYPPPAYPGDPAGQWEEPPPSEPSRLPLILAAIATALALGAIALAVTSLFNDEEPAPEEAAGPIQSTDIADGAITADKLADGAVIEVKLADGAVATGKLGDQAVVNAKLANAAVSNNRIASGAVGTQRIADQAVNGGKVQDDSLTGDDIDESTLGKVPSAQQADTAEVAQSVEGLDLGNLVPSIELAQGASDSSSDDAKSASAACPDGTQLVGGGGGIGGDATGVAMVRSSADGNGWTVAAQEIAPSEADWSVDAVAFCVSLS